MRRNRRAWTDGRVVARVDHRGLHYRMTVMTRGVRGLFSYSAADYRIPLAGW